MNEQINILKSENEKLKSILKEVNDLIDGTLKFDGPIDSAIHFQGLIKDIKEAIK